MLPSANPSAASKDELGWTSPGPASLQESRISGAQPGDPAMLLHLAWAENSPSQKSLLMPAVPSKHSGGQSDHLHSLSPEKLLSEHTGIWLLLLESFLDFLGDSSDNTG